MNAWDRLFRRRELADDLDEEMRAHQRMAVEERMGRGESAADAASAARREFGNSLLTREVTREMWGWTWLERAAQDVRYALRQLRRNPGFTAVAILSLALGVGANTAIFSVVKSMLLDPLPYPEGDRLVMVWERLQEAPRNTPAPANFVDWRVENQVFEGMAAHISGIFGDSALSGAGEPEQVHGAQVSANLFRLLRVQPALGSDFQENDDQTGARVAILSDSLWRRRFGASRDAIGRTISLDGNGYTIVGVMPRSFAYPATQIDLWTPLAMNTPRLRSREAHFLQVLGRLKPGVTFERAANDMDTIAKRLEIAYPRTNTAVGTEVVPLREQLVGDIRPILLLLLTAVGLVLLMVCANIANLLLARALARQREMALRSALGASRAAVLRQLLTESLVLSLGGAVAGLIAGYWALDGILKMIPRDLVVGKFNIMPQQFAGSVDWRVAAYAFGISILTGVLFGLAPALSSRRADLMEVLKAGSRSLGAAGQSARLRSALVIAETALAFALLIGAGLTLRSFAALASVKPGFESSHVLTMSLNLVPSQSPSAAQRSARIREVLRRVSEVPGVQSVGIINLLPLTFRGGVNAFYVEGTPIPAEGHNAAASDRIVSPGYFTAMGIPLRAGRYLEERDVANAPLVAVINETMARRFFPGGNALGKRFKLGRADDVNRPWYTVAGITGDVRQFALDAEPTPEMYFHYEQSNFSPPRDLVIRTAGDPIQLVRAVQLAIRRVDPEAPTFRVRTMTDVVDVSVALPRLEAFLLGGFGWLAIVLATVGIYGVVSYAVSQRNTEIGIRIALGAKTKDVLWMVLKSALVLIAFGLLLGVPAVLLASRSVVPLLYGLNANDLTTPLAAAALLAGVAMLAALAPAWRASRVNPVVALRSE